MFRVSRVINNNVISAFEGPREVILTGRGLGFALKPGGTYDPAKVERRFVLADDKSAAGFTAVISELPYEVLVLSNQITDFVESELGLKLTAPIQLALADHIQFAIERLASGQRLENNLLWELKSTYRREFTASLQILDMVRQATKVVLPVEEAGFITMHLVNAELTGDMASTLGTTSAVTDMVAIVRAQLGVTMSADSPAYARFLTHLKFAVGRVEDNQLLGTPDSATLGLSAVSGGLYQIVAAQDPQAQSCALALADYVLDRYQVVLPEEELLYLMLHINRLRTRDAQRP